MDYGNLVACDEEWNALTEEFKQLEDVHKQYQQKLEEIGDFQERCSKGIGHQKYRLSIISRSIKGLKKRCTSSEESQKVHSLEKELLKRHHQIEEMETYLPRKNGLYLRIILGNVNVSLLNKNAKYQYKDEYEKFKLIITTIVLGIAFLNYMITKYRFMDLLLLFLLVWYYCTLTIRESILKVNGSRIKGWWRAHHFISTAAAGVLLIWPDGPAYWQFRNQFMIFNIYIGLVQLLQFRYQEGCLYRLKALGERHNMDITIEGFHSWMWKGLSFLLPFLFFGYFFQLYNAYTLFLISHQDDCKEWQVIVLSAMFLTLFLGNMITTSMVIPQKLKENIRLKYRFQRSFMSKKRSKDHGVDASPGEALSNSDKRD